MHTIIDCLAKRFINQNVPNIIIINCKNPKQDRMYKYVFVLWVLDIFSVRETYSPKTLLETNVPTPNIGAFAKIIKFAKIEPYLETVELCEKLNNLEIE